MALLILGTRKFYCSYLFFSVYYMTFDGILSFYPLDASSTPNKEKGSQTLLCDARAQSTPSHLPQPSPLRPTVQLEIFILLHSRTERFEAKRNSRILKTHSRQVEVGHVPQFGVAWAT